MREIIEIIITSINHLEASHIEACADQSLLLTGYSRSSSVKIRPFSKENGNYNHDGKWFTINAFNKIKKNRISACYDELIEATFSVER